MLLENKVAIVTGGTRGIGLAVVRKFLDNGAKVALFGSREETVARSLAALKESYPEERIMGCHPNLSVPAEVEAAVKEVVGRFGTVDILVNNAGVSARDPLYNYDPDDFAKVMELNVNGVFNCTRVVAPIMKEHGGGSIINTSSMVSLYGQPAGVAYPASKFAVNGMTKSLARELGRDNIRVNAVAPGVTRTDMVAALPPEMVARISSTIPLGRVGEPEEVAECFLFLASNMASYVTGTILSCDGATMT